MTGLRHQSAANRGLARAGRGVGLSTLGPSLNPRLATRPALPGTQQGWREVHFPFEAMFLCGFSGCFVTGDAYSMPGLWCV